MLIIMIEKELSIRFLLEIQATWSTVAKILLSR